MHRGMAVVHEALVVVERPGAVDAVRLVAGVRPRGSVAALQRAETHGLVLDGTDEAAAAAHDELAVPVVRQPDREVDLAAEPTGELAVGHRLGAVHGLGDGQFRQPQPLEFAAGVRCDVRVGAGRRKYGQHAARDDVSHGSPPPDCPPQAYRLAGLRTTSDRRSRCRAAQGRRTASRPSGGRAPSGFRRRRCHAPGSSRRSA